MTNLHSLSPKKLLVAALFVALLIMAAVAGRLYKHARGSVASPTTRHGKHSMVLYFRDGKTVLWKSDEHPDWWNAQQSGFAGAVLDELKAKVGNDQLKEGAWQVTTTLDPSLQLKATEQLTTRQEQLNQRGAKSGAIIAEDVTNGQIVSWVGGFDAAADAADTVNQQAEVGTLTLPFTYAAIIEKSPTVNADTKLTDIKKALPGYPCTDPAPPKPGTLGNCLYNFDYKFSSELTLSQALGTLRLVPAVTASQQYIGLKQESTQLQTFAENLTTNGKFACYSDESLRNRSTCYTAATFGDGLFAAPKDIIAAYATLANNGKKVVQTSLLRASADDKTAYEWRAATTKQVIKQSTARTITDILADPQASYIPQSYRNVFSVNGAAVSVVDGYEHAGTTNSTVQFNAKYAIGVWALGKTQSITGPIEPLILPAANQWLQAAQ